MAASVLKAARDAFAKEEYREALQHCKAALKADRASYEALLLVGKCAFQLGEFQQAELAYRRAVEARPELPAAWKGLAELGAASGGATLLAEASAKLLELLPSDDPRRRDHRLALADALARSGDLAGAERALRTLLLTECAGSGAGAGAVGQPPCGGDPQRLHLLCRLADVQLKLDEAAAAAELESRMSAAGSAAQRTVSLLQLDVLASQALRDEAAPPDGGLASCGETLEAVCGACPPSLRYLQYHEERLKRALLRIFAAPPRSVERQHRRLAALRECCVALFGGRGGALSALPYEAAVWLLEEEEEIKGGHAPVGGQVVGSSATLAGGVQSGAEACIGGGQQVAVYALENFARRLAHQFPANPTAQACLALMLRRRAYTEGRPVPAAARRGIASLLERAMAEGPEGGADCASGWKALAELQYENRRRERGHEALTQCALALRLVLAKALRRQGKVDAAEGHFKVLAGWVTEGEAAFSELSGSAPVSIHQQALRGIALCALERGDRAGAKAQYERILGKAALGRGPGENWAHADYGWLLAEEGDLQGARSQLEAAVQVASAPGCAVTDSQLGEHRWRLGQVYWRLRGRYRTEKQFAYAQYLEAARVEGHAQAPALAALGRYFLEVEGSQDSAQRCFKRALAIDPGIDLAGDPESAAAALLRGGGAAAGGGSAEGSAGSQDGVGVVGGRAASTGLEG